MRPFYIRSREIETAEQWWERMKDRAYRPPEELIDRIGWSKMWAGLKGRSPMTLDDYKRIKAMIDQRHEDDLAALERIYAIVKGAEAEPEDGEAAEDEQAPVRKRARKRGGAGIHWSVKRAEKDGRDWHSLTEEQRQFYINGGRHWEEPVAAGNGA